MCLKLRSVNVDGIWVQDPRRGKTIRYVSTVRIGQIYTVFTPPPKGTTTHIAALSLHNECALTSTAAISTSALPLHITAGYCEQSQLTGIVNRDCCSVRRYLISSQLHFSVIFLSRNFILTPVRSNLYFWVSLSSRRADKL